MTQGTPFIGEFSDDDWAWVLKNSAVWAIGVNKEIIREGCVADHIFVILAGGFQVTSATTPVPPQMRLGKGEIAGEISAINKKLTIRAVVESVVLAIPRRALEGKIATDAGFAARFNRVVNESTADHLKRLHENGDGPAAGGPARSRPVEDLIEQMIKDFSPSSGSPPSSSPPASSKTPRQGKKPGGKDSTKPGVGEERKPPRGKKAGGKDPMKPGDDDGDGGDGKPPRKKK